MDAESGTDILGPKKLNYEFLMLVRDKKYPEALVLGKKILETEPNNPSVKKFCDFILANNRQLQKMVKEEKEEEQYESVDSDDEGEEGEEGQEDDKKEDEDKSDDEDDSKEDSKEEEEEEEEEEPKEEKEKPKIELRTCTLNQIPHICTRDHN